MKLETGSPADTEMDIRLAIDSVEYYVPFALTQGEGGATVTIRNVAADALCWDSIKVSDTFDTTNRDKFRPLYPYVLYWTGKSGEGEACPCDKRMHRAWP